MYVCMCFLVVVCPAGIGADNEATPTIEEQSHFNRKWCHRWAAATGANMYIPVYTCTYIYMYIAVCTSLEEGSNYYKSCIKTTFCGSWYLYIVSGFCELTIAGYAVWNEGLCGVLVPQSSEFQPDFSMSRAGSCWEGGSGASQQVHAVLLTLCVYMYMYIQPFVCLYVCVCVCIHVLVYTTYIHVYPAFCATQLYFTLCVCVRVCTRVCVLVGRFREADLATLLSQTVLEECLAHLASCKELCTPGAGQRQHSNCSVWGDSYTVYLCVRVRV